MIILYKAQSTHTDRLANKRCLVKHKGIRIGSGNLRTSRARNKRANKHPPGW